MTFSIVTVVFNDINHIEKTMRSVINQTYKNIEYILIDGASTDGTKEKIQEIILQNSLILEERCNDFEYFLHSKCKDSNFTFKFLSQKDKGIFDAMNKGVMLSQNDFINFANCGDNLHDENVLQRISSLDFKADIFYGDLEICYLDHNHNFIKKTSRNLNNLYRLFYGFGHPNCFIKTSLHKKYLYNTNYKLASDYDLIYKLHKNNFEFYFSDIIISTFNSGGASDKNGFKSLKEALNIALHYNPNLFMKIKVISYYLFALCKKTVKLYMPIPLVQSLLKFKKN